MSVKKRLLYFLMIDSLIVFTSVYVCSFLLNTNCNPFIAPLFLIATTLLISYHALAYGYQLYSRAWEYASMPEMIVIFKVVTFSIIIAGGIQFMIVQEVFLRTLAVTCMILLFLIGASRFSWRYFHESTSLGKSSLKKRVLIIGAGSAGTLIARQLKQRSDGELHPIGFIDDDKQKHHLQIFGMPVFGGIEVLQETVKWQNINNIVIAIPSLNRKALQRIYEHCKKTRARTQIIPMFEDLVTGKLSVNEIQDVEIGELLGRKQVEFDTSMIETYIHDSVVLVTGAGGSIGSEICRQIASFSPAKLILLGHGENSIYSIHKELQSIDGNQTTLVTEIADVKDREKMFEIMEKHRPRVVFHAAAHKHVPLMEQCPEEAVKNNVVGTKNLVEAAHAFTVETFVMISTDKAVKPTSVMGATKRLAEMIVQDFNRKSKTRFVAVRFGNVLGSRGSVIPLFMEQIKSGGPVTVTHPDMERYFMTIPEASKLVLQAGALAKGGEIFVLDMGEAVKISELAKNLIRLSGFSADEIEIEYTGIRDGEKLFEEILSEDEVHEQQIYPKIRVGKCMEFDIDQVMLLVKNFNQMDKDGLRKQLLGMTNPRYYSRKEVI